MAPGAMRGLVTKTLLFVAFCGRKYPISRNRKTGCVPHGPRGPGAQMQRTGLSRNFAGVRGKLAAAGLAALVAFGSVSGAAPQAQAQDNQPVNYITEEETPLNYAAQELEKYSKETGGVGVIMSYQAWDGGYTAEAIQAKFRERFAQFDSEVSFRVVPGNGPGASFIFVTYDVFSESHSPNEAWANVERFVKINRAARKLHGKQTSELSQGDEELTTGLN